MASYKTLPHRTKNSRLPDFAADYSPPEIVTITMNHSFLQRGLPAKLLLWLACAIFFCSCGQKSHKTADGTPEQKNFSKASDLNTPNCVIAAISNMLATKEGKAKLPQATFLELNLPPDCYAALESKKADAFVYDRCALEHAVFSRNDFVILPDNIAIGHVAIGAPKKQANLMKRVNAFIKKYREDGTYQKMYDHWIKTQNPKMPDITPPKAPDGTIVIGIDAVNPPMTYMENGKYIGFDIEFSHRLAAFLNKKIEFRSIAYDGLVAAMEAGKIDLAIAQMDATDERKESILFSEDYIDAPVSLMVRREDYPTPYTTLASLKDQKIGTLTGSTFATLAKEYMPTHEILSYNRFTDIIAALEGKKIDAFYCDVPIARFILLRRPKLTLVPQKIPCGSYGFLFAKSNQQLCDAISTEIRNMKHDGTLEKLQDAWFAVDESQKILDTPIESDRILKLCVFAEAEPFVYIHDNKIVGYEVAVATKVANKLGYKLVTEMCEFQGIIENVVSGKADFACGCIIDTPERRESVLFSAPTYDGGIALAVRKENEACNAPLSFSQWMKHFSTSMADSFCRTFIRESRWKLILQGLVTTLVITVCSALLGTILALPLSLVCMSKRPFLAKCGKHFISLIMGTPLLVILMILYYVIFAKVDIDGIFVAIIAFALDFAVYTSVTLQSGIEGIPRGQTEAALALGHKPALAFLRFILPQAVRAVLPVYVSEIVSTLKSTSIVGYIAIMDLTKMGDIIRSRTYEAFFPLIAIAIIYFLTAKALSLILEAVEHRIAPANRRNRLMKGVQK